MKVKEESEKAGLKLCIQKTKIMASASITSWKIDGETMETVWDFIFLGSKITADGNCSHEIKRCLLLGRKAGFSSSHYGCESCHKESWMPKNWCFWTVVLGKTLENPLDSKVIKPINPKGNQSWIFTRRADVEAEAPILWPPDVKN